MLLADDSGVLWAEGFGADARRLADENTKKFLLVKVERKTVDEQ